MTASSRMISRMGLGRVVAIGVSLWFAGLCMAQTVGSGSEITRSAAAHDQRVDWPVYRGDPGANQYSALAQINATNVHKLTRAWEHHTGDATERSTMYSNPLVVDGLMYFSTPSTKAVALNAATGEQVWSFDPAVYNDGRVVRLRNRGVTYWKGAEGERIFHFVGDRVYALDARSGELL